MKSIVFFLSIFLASTALQAQYFWIDSVLSDYQSNSTVYKQLRVGDTLIAFGSFGSIIDTSTNQSILRNRICAFDLAGDSLLPWSPGVSGGVDDMIADESHVYIGGNMTLFAGDTCKGLVRLHRNSLALDTSWQPEITGTVLTMAEDSTRLYVGGSFNQVGDSNRTNLASILKSNGSVTAWNPSPNSNVMSLTFHGDTLYAGGVFAQISGVSRSQIARFLPNGTLDSWSPALQHSYSNTQRVNRIAVVNNTVFAITYSYRSWYYGGWYSRSYGSYHEYRLQSISGESTTQEWRVYGGYSRYSSRYGSSYYSYGSVWFGDLVVVGDSIFIGGRFQSGSRYVPVRYLYMHNAQTGNIALAGDVANGVSVNSTIYSLQTDGDRLYVGGAFTLMGTTLKPRLGVYNLRKPIPVWTGVGDWVADAATNWSTGAVPVATDSVIIKYGEVTLTDSTEVRSMLLKTNADVIVAGDSANLVVSQRTHHLSGGLTGDNEGTLDLEGNVCDESNPRIRVSGDRIRLSGRLEIQP